MPRLSQVQSQVMPRLQRVLGAALIACTAIAPAQGQPTAAAVTEPGRSLRRPLDLFLCAASSDAKSPRGVLFVLLDPSTSVAKAGFAKEFTDAVARSANDLQGVKLGVRALGYNELSPPTLDHVGTAKLIDRALAARIDRPQNLFAAVRAATAMLAKETGPRHLLLVSFDNGEAEDDLEGTARLLQQKHVEFSVLTVEACLADSYWLDRRSDAHEEFGRRDEVAEGAVLVGGEAPRVDVPFGFPFQRYAANIVTPAAFAPYALSRLVQAGGGRGRVLLYSDGGPVRHHCILFGDCPDCHHYFHWGSSSTDADRDREWHADHTERYLATRLQQMAPLVCSRADALKALAKDPNSRTTLAAWRRGCEEGLVGSLPDSRDQDNGVAEFESEEMARNADLLASLQGIDPRQDRARAATTARKFADKALEIETQLARAITPPPSGANTRQFAIANYTRLMFLLSRVSLLSYERFLRVDVPALLLAEPVDRGKECAVTWHEQSICHGMGVYLRREPEGPARAEMARLAKLLDEFERDHGGSPISFALRRMSFPKFQLTSWQSEPDVPPRVPSETPKPPTTPARPKVPRPTSSPPSGPTTGGG